ncbi:MAG: DinB family protein, partial [Chloroflexi bacterium]|nr:DinB family protein [Chloroflexota bacterium]
ALSAGLDMPALRAYRLAVGQRTRHIVAQIRPADLKKKIDPSRLEQVLADGAVVEATRSMLEYWGSLSLAGLLLMPPTRHQIIHLNEALRLKRLCKNL